MQILIDECLDWRLCRVLRDHYCISVAKMGWSGLSNGALLERAAEKFDVFLTGDLNLTFQQNLTRFSIAVIVLEAASTRLTDTSKLMPEVLKTLQSVQPGQVVRIGITP